VITGAKAFYIKHSKWVPIVFFLLGFLFDVFTLQRIDDLFSILQQGIYLAIAGALINLELLEHCGHYHAGQGLWARAWQYREAAIHFILGSLLSAYTLFYFKSASMLTSFAFVGFLVVVLILNEFKKFDKTQTVVHMTLWCLCVISYSLYLVPTLLGFIGVLPFLGSILCSGLLSFYVYFRLGQRARDQHPLLKRRVLLPFVLVHVLFVILYFSHAIPPVPLSVSFIGIYHGVEKREGKYQLSFTDPAWQIFHNGDGTFSARTGDKLYCFARIFSPTNFQDKLNVRWLYQDAKKRWMTSDTIALPITGGRDQGFRGYTAKSNYWPGKWRCQIETSEFQEIGRVTFDVTADTGTEERVVRVAEQ